MKRLNEKQWRSETDQKSAMLLKAVDTEVTEAADDRVLNFRISTETVDSYGDVIKSDGWVLDRFLKNPVVLWAHSRWSPSIGKALSIGVEDNALVASAEFADAETYAFADTIYRLLKGKFLRATSVGFFPKEWVEVKDEERWGYDFTKQELFEFSIVPVPANPDALTLAAQTGIDCAPIRKWAEEALDLWEEDKKTGLVLPRSTIEAVYATTGNPTAWVQVPSESVASLEGDEFYHTFDGTGHANFTELGGTSTPVTTDTVITTVGQVELFGDPIGQPNGDDLPGDVKGDEKPLGTIKVEVDADILSKLSETIVILSDEIESLKAEIDQLRAASAEKEQKTTEPEDVEEKGELFDVIDIQGIDSTEVESEVDRSILDLDIDAEALHEIVRRQVEVGLMTVTGKLPKEV